MRTQDQVLDTEADSTHSYLLDELDSIEGGNTPTKVIFGSLLDEARHDFVETAKKEIDLVNAGMGRQNKYGMPVTAWTQAETSGRYKVVLKARGGVLSIKGKTYFYLPDREKTCEFIAKVAIAAERGALDKHLNFKQKPKAPQTHNAVMQRIHQQHRAAMAERMGYEGGADQ